jgi:hypothetical protein
MMFADRALAVAFGAGALAALTWASAAPMTVHGSEQGMLRLAWSARPERIEDCRQQSEEELARLPQHMRQPVLCDGASAAYRLTVRAGDTLLAEQIVRGGGWRQDRRLYVFHEVPLEAGEVFIDVRFDRLDSGAPQPTPADHGRPQAQGRTPDAPGGETVPPHLSFEQRLRVQPRAVVLITYSPERRSLIAVEADEDDDR